MKDRKVIRIVVGICMLIGGIGFAVHESYLSAASSIVFGVVFLIMAFKNEK